MEKQSPAAGVVLAAGAARRFGSAKQLALLDGRTLLEHVLAAADDAGLRPIVAVVPIWLTRPATFDAPWLSWVRNAYPERGISQSLRLGFAALPAPTGAAVILLGDQPTVRPRDIRRLIEARGSAPIVAWQVDGHPAPPMLVERERFDLVEDAAGDVGLREILRPHPEWVRLLDGPPHPDVDTRDDLDALSDG